MNTYHVIVTDDANEDLRRYRDYLLYIKKSPQAARNIVLDFRETRKQLETVAGSLKAADSKELKRRSLKRINFLKHDYFLLYYVEEYTVYITNMFHALEDYESKLR